MPEGVRPYPRWQGSLAPTSRWPTVAGDELRRARRSTWALLAVGLGLAWGVASVIELVQFRRDGWTTHSWDAYLAMLDQLRWFALAAAAAIGAPSLLQDARRGALELYFSRAVSPRSYLAGKTAAVAGLVAATMVLPALLYYAATLALYDTHPDDWHQRALAAGLAYSLAWTLLVAGLALGVSVTARSARAAALLLFGGFVGLHIVVGSLLSFLTGDERLQVLSPFAAFTRLHEALFPVDNALAFPLWWALCLWAALAILGWALLLWRRPRLRGEE